MSFSKSLLRAAKIQEKIDALRGQLTELLDRARTEVAAQSDEETEISVRRGVPKRLKVGRGKQTTEAPAGKSSGTGRRTSKGGKVSVGARQRRSPLAGRRRAASPSGPLAPAVVKVLRTRKKPLRVADILAGLLANGYQFNATEPRKNLAARIYRLKGVKQVDAGLFGLA